MKTGPDNGHAAELTAFAEKPENIPLYPLQSWQAEIRIVFGIWHETGYIIIKDRILNWQGHVLTHQKTRLRFNVNA